MLVAGGQCLHHARSEGAGRQKDDQATLRLISRDDSLAAQQLDLQRWDLAITDPVVTQVLVKPGDGLHWVTSHGDTQRGGRVAGWPDVC